MSFSNSRRFKLQRGITSQKNAQDKERNETVLEILSLAFFFKFGMVQIQSSVNVEGRAQGSCGKAQYLIITVVENAILTPYSTGNNVDKEAEGSFKDLWKMGGYAGVEGVEDGRQEATILVTQLSPRQGGPGCSSLQKLSISS